METFLCAGKTGKHKEPWQLREGAWPKLCLCRLPRSQHTQSLGLQWGDAKISRVSAVSVSFLSVIETVLIMPVGYGDYSKCHKAASLGIFSFSFEGVKSEFYHLLLIL